MLIEFSVENYLSFKDLVTLSMVASSIKEHEKENVIHLNNGKSRLLKSSAIYGANASGKSNLIKAIAFMINFIHSSSKDSQIGEKIEVDKFKLSTESENKPSFFEIIFLIENIKYRYGFEVDENIVHSEWLFSTPKTKETTLFTRDKNKIEVKEKNFKEGKGLEDKTRNNSLFLSVVAQFNGKISSKLLEYFHNINIISSLYEDGFNKVTKRLLEKNKISKEFISKFLKIADLGIDDISLEKIQINNQKLTKNLPDDLKNVLLSYSKKEDTIVYSFHNKYDENNNLVDKVKFDIAEKESHGTKKFLGLLGPIVDTLVNGKILIVDELDSQLHPLLTQAIIKMFNSEDLNINSSQLIFSTHDTNLLKKELLRRDQIWFTEKTNYGVTDLYSLVEYNVRNDATFNKDYIIGKYGAIPFLGNMESLIKDYTNESKN